MLPELPRELAHRQGPFATACIDVSRDHEDAPREIELRAEDVVRRLREQGADDATAKAVQEALTAPHTEPGRVGRGVVAAGGEVLLDVPLAAPPRREVAAWAPLPHLLAVLAQAAEELPHVVVTLSKTRAVVHEVGAGSDATTETRGREENTHKARGGGMAHRNMQSRVEEVWASNARQFAHTVRDAVARVHAEVVVVVGEVQDRTILLDHLDERSRSLAVQVEGPGAGDAAPAEDAPDERVREVVAERAARRSADLVDSVARELGRRSGLATTGLAGVVQALQLQQVDVLVVVDDPSSDARLWVGPGPAELALTEDDLRGIGADVLGEDRADAALVRAVAGTGARLLVLRHPDAGSDPARAGSAAGGAPVPADVPGLADGVGALLRFSTDPDAPANADPVRDDS